MNAVTDKMPAMIAGYKTFELGAFTFARDEYFVTITWPVQGGRRQSHTISADAFLRALMRDLAWGFFLRRGQFRSGIRHAQFVWQG